LFTQGFFKVTLSKEYGAFETMKLAVVEFKEFTFRFSKWKSQFNPNTPGAEFTLSYILKV
jgi:hypothetical protein